MSLMDHLERAYYRYRPYIPSRWLYHRQYFDVLNLSERRRAGNDLKDERNARLRDVLRLCIEHVPYYRSSVRITAAEIQHEDPVEVIGRFPLLEKQEIMARQKEFLNETLNPGRLHYATSGGSTGEGIGLWRNKRLADVEKAFFTAAWGTRGFSFDKSRYLRIGADARAQAHEPPTRILANRLMLSPYHLNAGHKAAILKALRDFRPEFIHAYPSVAAELAHLTEGEELGFQVKGVFLASEPATLDQLNAIHRVFTAPISVNYGLTERTNIAFADYQPGQTLTFKFDSLYGYSENRAVDGRYEIVGTSLWNDIMPLVRYCTKDYGRLDAAGHCRELQGRSQEFLVDRNGGRIPGLSIVIDEVTWDFIRLYQVRQTQAGQITIALVPRQGALTPEQRQFVLDAQLRRWGTFFDIAVEVVSDIPVSANGKRKLVVVSP